MKKNKYYKILLYHGVSNYSNYKGIENFSKKHISKSVFLKQMKYLKKTCNLISFNDLTKYKKKGEIPKNTVLITFDDGFENNYKVAFPILKKFKKPAIFYVSAGMIGKEKMFWVDKIEDIIIELKKNLEDKIKKKKISNAK